MINFSLFFVEIKDNIYDIFFTSVHTKIIYSSKFLK